MRLRNVTGADEMIAHSPFVIHEPEKHKGMWREIFQNNHPIRIEIGMGKGQFLMELARQNPQINYIGIEKYTTVLLRAVQKMEVLELPNVKFLCVDAKGIVDYFGEGEVDRIYLNFSDPWPKDRHAKRRLPSKEFLTLYDSILKRDGVIEFKTDNKGLFDFAVKQLIITKWYARELTYDLHQDEKMVKGNIMTEYEEKFSNAGNPICKYIIQRDS